MRLIIADDEIHICTLIRHLIDWEGIGVEFCGAFSNGLEVMEYLETNSADILICDIEMPGMDGIELMKNLSEKHPGLKIVVISGFRSFEYARSAMRYGVTNYLLKPIDEKELNNALRSIVSSPTEEERQESMILRASGRLQLAPLLRNPGQRVELSAINKNYHYDFVDGRFTVLRVVFTGVEHDSDTPPIIARMFEEILRPKLAELCHEFEFYRENALNTIVLVNCDKGAESLAHLLLDGALQSAIVEFGCKSPHKLFVGVGEMVSSFAEVDRSFLKAWRVTDERFKGGETRVFYSTFYSANLSDERMELVPPHEKRALQRIVEEISPDEAEGWVERIFRYNERAFDSKPWLISECCRTVFETLITIMDSVEVPIGNREKFLQQSQLEIDGAESAEAAEKKLIEIINQEITGRLAQKLTNVSVYAQQAKQYIERNYMYSVTLEKIAAELNINPAYLSVVFKNEVKMNYSKYLTMVRMEHAKELLKGCDKNLTQVANAVGYDRTSYFSGLFRAYTGIRPTEYQRLHQHNIGD